MSSAPASSTCSTGTAMRGTCGTQTTVRGTYGTHMALPRLSSTASCFISLILFLTLASVSMTSSIERCVTPAFTDVPSRTLAASLVLEVRAPARLKVPLAALRGAAGGAVRGGCDVVFKVRQVHKGRLVLKEPPLVQEGLPLILVSLCDPGLAGSPAEEQGPLGGPAGDRGGSHGGSQNLPSATSNGSLHGNGFSKSPHKGENGSPAHEGAAVGDEDCVGRILPHGLETNYLLFVNERRELGAGLNSRHALQLPYIRLGSAPEQATKRHVTEVSEYSCTDAKCG